LNRDIIFISLEDWDEVWRRNQIVCDELARRDPARRIVFVGRARDVSNAVRRGKMGPVFFSPPPVEASRPNIVTTSAIKLLPNSIPAARAVNEWFLRRHLKSLVRKLHIVNPILWINDHAAVHLVDHLGESGTVYDITDDWLTLAQSPRLTALIRRQDQTLCEKADAIIACSTHLVELKRSFSEKMSLIPNGVDLERYARPLLPPKDLTPLKASHPLVGYVGTIHPDRLDVPLLIEVAKILPQATFLLIGPNHLDSTDRDRLALLPNVKLKAPIPFEDVPAWMQAFDVAMTPHRVTPFTESLNPIKLWEYLAVGRPIVSTPVAGFREFPQWVDLASTAWEFAAAITLSLGEPPALMSGRRAEAAKNSWALRVDQIEEVLRRLGPREGVS
jgi:teichuronic acid biosynthesis glycosyltransferase TuaH